MIIFTSLAITAVLLMIQGFVNALIPYSLELALSGGLVIYFLLNKKVGLVVIYAQAIVFDLIYASSLPINTISLTIIYLIWRSVIERSLVLINFSSKLLSMLILLICYYIVHWFLAWWPYWLGDQIMYPNIYSWWSYFISVIATLVILAILSWIIFFLNSRLHVKR